MPTAADSLNGLLLWQYVQKCDGNEYDAGKNKLNGIATIKKKRETLKN